MNIVNQNGLQQCATNNQLVPAEGPKSIPVSLDFAALIAAGLVPEFTLDYGNQQAQAQFSVFQSVYMDNAVNGSPLTMLIETTQQSITCPANSQGYFAVLCQNPLKLRFSSNGNVRVSVHLLNFPVAPAVWLV